MVQHALSLFNEDKGLEYDIIPYDDYSMMEHMINDGWHYVGRMVWVRYKDRHTSFSKNKFLPKVNGNQVFNKDIVLTFPKISDVEELYRNEQDNLVRQHAIFPPFSKADIEQAVIDSYPKWRLGDSTMLIAREWPGGPALAKLSIRRLVPPDVLDMGYMTINKHRGKGVSALALRIFTKWAFESAGIQRIELGIKPSNIPSVRTAEKAGYQLESVRHARLLNKDSSFEDEHSYVAIKNEKNRTWESLQ